MDSFEELGVTPELVEALAAEGIERPTPLQESAIPVLRQGNNLVLAAGPGSGVLVAWAIPLLEATAIDAEVPAVVVLTATSEVADRLAESLARISSMTGHTVAALGSPWSMPERAHILFATAEELLARLSKGGLSLDGVQALVVDQAQAIEQLIGLEGVERVFDYLPQEAQRIVSALPVSDAVTDLVERHVRRAATVPAADPDKPLHRGTVRFRIAPEPRETAALAVADELLSGGGARHLLFFCGSEDRAADLGDFLTLHGYMAGSPGDTSAPVWLAVDALAARSAAQGVDDVTVVSCDVPTDLDVLDRRHGISPNGVVIILPREVAHLKSTGRRAGYETVPFPPPTGGPPSEIQRIRAQLEKELEGEGSGVYLPVLEPLFARHDPAEVAAAAVALLREKLPTGVGTVQREAEPNPSAPAAGPSWAKLFIGVGERDGLRAGDLVGAITGEAGVDGQAVGKIDIRESHSVVEVHDTVARQVIKALNGTTIKGRAVRADFDRPRRGAPPRARR